MYGEESFLSEKFSEESAKAREENRIISAITAFTLIREGRYPDAKIFAESFAEIKDLSAKALAKEVGCYFVSSHTNTDKKSEIGEKMLTVANVLASDPASINEAKAIECTTILTELLDAINTDAR